MFKEAILNTPFTTRAANVTFENIGCVSIKDDNTLLTNLRVLLHDKLTSESPCFNGGFLNAHLRDESYLVRNLNWSTGNRLCVVNAGSLNYNVLVEKLNSAGYTGYEEVKKVHAFFQKSMEVHCILSKERRISMVFVQDLTVQKLHYIQSALPVFLPWFYPQGDQIPELDMRLIKSMMNKDSAEYLSIINEVAKGMDFESSWIKTKIGTLTTARWRSQIQNFKNSIKDFEDEISRHMNTIASRAAQIDDYNAMIFGLEDRISRDDGGTELLRFLDTSPNVKLCDADNGGVYITSWCHVTEWDRIQSQKMIEDKRSCLYRDLRVATEDAQKLYKALFIDASMKLRFYSAGYLNLSNHEVSSRLGYGYTVNDCCPNPHHSLFDCFGGYMQDFARILKAGDLIGAISLFSVSVSSLNFFDHAVMSNFSNVLFRDDSGRCIELPDGTLLTPLEAIDYINGNHNG